MPGSHVYVQLSAVCYTCFATFRRHGIGYSRRSFQVAVHADVPGARSSRVCSARSVVSAGVLSLGGLEVKEAPTVVSSSRATAQCFPIADVAVDVLMLFFTELVARASGETAGG
jgi:hypothetical protein